MMSGPEEQGQRRASRILIYGVTGSGKTTLARRMGGLTGLPWHSVDDLTWEPNWVVVPIDEQRRRIAMIAQMVAIDHPDRVCSLGLLSSIPGRDPRYILHGERQELTVVPPRRTREEVVASAAAAFSPTSPQRYRWQEEWMRWAAGEAYDRGYAPEGYARQWSALRRAPERLERLRGVTVPTLVLHGRDDDVLHWCAAVDTAAAVPGSELQIHPDMGHLIPWELWPDVVTAVVRTARRGEERAAAEPAE